MGKESTFSHYINTFLGIVTLHSTYSHLLFPFGVTNKHRYNGSIQDKNQIRTSPTLIYVYFKQRYKLFSFSDATWLTTFL